MNTTPRTEALAETLYPKSWHEAYAEMKKHAVTLERELDALLCNCATKYTTLWGGENMDVPRCPECGKMRVQSPENAGVLAHADQKLSEQ